MVIVLLLTTDVVDVLTVVEFFVEVAIFVFEDAVLFRAVSVEVVTLGFVDIIVEVVIVLFDMVIVDAIEVVEFDIVEVVLFQADIVVLY